jgi:hypothetical protein
VKPTWEPPWRTLDQASGYLVVASRAGGVEVVFRSVAGSSVSRPWMSDWLRRFAVTPPHNAIDDETSFFYVLFGDPEGATADGLVDGVAVIECGYGTQPAGPEDGTDSSLATLTSIALAFCDNSVAGL